MIYVVGRSNKREGVLIDTTSRGRYAELLSPFYLRFNHQLVENIWQYSKVYEDHVDPDSGLPNHSWRRWNRSGVEQDRAVRYPMGKGAVPEYCFSGTGDKLGYVEARKEIYCPVYAGAIEQTKCKEFSAFKSEVLAITQRGDNVLLWDFDSYDAGEITQKKLVKVLNNPDKKMGHSFVVAGLLLGYEFWK